jgi:hypothetical protein
MKELIERFYDSILLTARIMDEVFAQIYLERNQSSIASSPGRGASSPSALSGSP